MTNGTLDELASRLKGHESDPLPKELQQAKKLARKETKIWEANSKENIWLNTITNVDKMTKNPERFLKEKYKAGDKNSEIVLIHLRDADIRLIAQSLGLECEIAREPFKGFDYSYSGMVSTAVVGQDKAAVAKKVQTVQVKEKRALRGMQEQRAEGEQQEKEWAHKRKEIKEGQGGCLESSKDFDPTGTWKIRRPYIVEQWGHMAQRKDPPLSMEIFT